MNVAIIGLGVISTIHINAINSYGANLVAVCDINEEKMQKYTCAKYCDYHELLKRDDIDIVHICTPHYLHPQMVIDCANAGKHVLVEKPASTQTEQLIRMIENKNGKKVSVCFQNRYNIGTIMAKDFIDNKTYGDILGVYALVPWYRNNEYYTNSDWRGKLSTEGGCLLVNQAIHTIDLMQYLVGEVESVKAHIDNYTHEGVIEGEDTATAAFYYKSGIVGMFFATNCYNSGSTSRIEIKCEKATLKLTEKGLFVDDELAAENVIAKTTKTYYGNAHLTLIHELYDEILGKGGSSIPLEDALPACRIIEAIYGSSNKNKKISIACGAESSLDFRVI